MPHDQIRSVGTPFHGSNEGGSPEKPSITLLSLLGCACRPSTTLVGVERTVAPVKTNYPTIDGDLRSRVQMPRKDLSEKDVVFEANQQPSHSKLDTETTMVPAAPAQSNLTPQQGGFQSSIRNTDLVYVSLTSLLHLQMNITFWITSSRRSSKPIPRKYLEASNEYD